jgi:hypothetical protein
MAYWCGGRNSSATSILKARRTTVPFRILKEVRPWFKGVEKELALDFDMYYFCLMAGLVAGRKRPSQGDDASDLAQDFPGEYRSRGRVIVALLLAKELRTLGVNFKERTTLHREVSKLIDPLSSSHLSAAGMEEMNRYSYGGFDVLTEWFEDRPRHLETFLPQLKKHIGIALDTSPQEHT